MKQETLVTIVTPTYNRAHTLPNLFDSLCKQTNKNFVWLIVDDGSEDSTETLCNSYQTAPFKVEYVKKKNGGKHTALNIASGKVKTELTFIVDSDDVLVPNAIDLIGKDWNIVAQNGEKVCGISYLRGYNEFEVIGDCFPKDNVIDNFIKLRYNENIKGDKAEVWVTTLLKQHTFPEFENESFMGEGYIWVKLAKEYDMLFRNQIIYITKYLDGGLSKSGRRLRIDCPLGGIENAKQALSSHFSLKYRVKSAWLYIAYSLFAKKTLKEIFSIDEPFIILVNFPFGVLLYYFWSFKYKRKRKNQKPA